MSTQLLHWQLSAVLALEPAGAHAALVALAKANSDELPAAALGLCVVHALLVLRLSICCCWLSPSALRCCDKCSELCMRCHLPAYLTGWGGTAGPVQGPGCICSSPVAHCPTPVAHLSCRAEAQLGQFKGPHPVPGGGRILQASAARSYRTCTCGCTACVLGGSSTVGAAVAQRCQQQRGPRCMGGVPSLNLDRSCPSSLAGPAHRRRRQVKRQLVPHGLTVLQLQQCVIPPFCRLLLAAISATQPADPALAPHCQPGLLISCGSSHLVPYGHFIRGFKSH